MTPSGNPFATETAWEASAGDAILAPGDHVVTIRDADGTGTSSGNYPQVELRMDNQQGQIRDWLVVIESTVGKLIQMFEAAGLERPTDDEVSVDGNGWRFAPKYLDQLVDRQVGVLVRDEPDYLDPSKTKTRVKGYVKPGEIGSDAPTDPDAFAVAPAKTDDDFAF